MLDGRPARVGLLVERPLRVEPLPLDPPVRDDDGDGPGRLEFLPVAARAAGVANFAGPKVTNPNDKSILWKVYSARVTAALDQFRKAPANNAAVARYQGKIGSLADAAIGNVLSRIEKGAAGQAPDPTALGRWRNENRDPTLPLAPFTDGPAKLEKVLKPVNRS